MQNSQASLRALCRRYGINQKTMAKWNKRSPVSDLPTGPMDAKSSVSSVEDDAIIVAFRRHMLPPLEKPNRQILPLLVRAISHCKYFVSMYREGGNHDRQARASFRRYFAD
jgi:hypothetical protein